LHEDIDQLKNSNPGEPTVEEKVVLVSQSIRKLFEKNDEILTSFKMQDINKEEVIEEHRLAVEDYNAVIRETLVWGDMLGQKIDLLLP